jgi:hypothetical protein
MNHFGTIGTLDDANEAVLDRGMALRVQPRAPAPTRFYFVEDGKWKLQKCGHSHASTVGVEHVRDVVSRHIPKNDRAGGGGVRAVDRDEVERYA